MKNKYPTVGTVSKSNKKRTKRQNRYPNPIYMPVHFPGLTHGSKSSVLYMYVSDMKRVRNMKTSFYYHLKGTDCWVGTK